MVYVKHYDLLDLKKRAGLTARDLSPTLGVAPSTVAGKLNGFVPLTDSEERTIRKACEKQIHKMEEIGGAGQ